MSRNSDFFRLFEGLTRVGPGCAADVGWAGARANVAADARIFDAGAGPGGDVSALRQLAPDGHVHAVDKHPPFIAHLTRKFADDAGVTGHVGDMMTAPGRAYDLIWCAGAIYNVGVTEALRRWRGFLAGKGCVAFSQIYRSGPDLPDEVRQLFDGVELEDADTIAGQVAAAGYGMVATRRLSDAAWEEYYRPLGARIAALRPQAGAGMARVLDQTEAEIAIWRKYRRDFGYLLCAVRPG